MTGKASDKESEGSEEKKSIQSGPGSHDETLFENEDRGEFDPYDREDEKGQDEESFSRKERSWSEGSGREVSVKTSGGIRKDGSKDEEEEEKGKSDGNDGLKPLMCSRGRETEILRDDEAHREEELGDEGREKSEEEPTMMKALMA